MSKNKEYEFSKYNPIACYYTDGSVRGNGQKNSIGAYGFIRIENMKVPDVFMSKTEYGVTNARMELKGILSACKDAERKYGDFDDKIVICTDYDIFIKTVKNEWYTNWLKNDWVGSHGRKIQHRGIWEALLPFIFDDRYIFIKVDGHDGDDFNNYVDRKVQNVTFEEKYCTDVILK